MEEVAGDVVQLLGGDQRQGGVGVGQGLVQAFLE